jgi:hypothetical protein
VADEWIDRRTGDRQARPVLSDRQALQTGTPTLQVCGPSLIIGPVMID